MDRPVKRWLALALGLSVAVAALALLATRGTGPREQIDSSSRAALERVLGDSEGEGAGR
jgi:hypothetical protein